MVDVRAIEERHRFFRQRVDQTSDPTDGARGDAFDDQIIDADEDCQPLIDQRPDRGDAANVCRRLFHRV